MGSERNMLGSDGGNGPDVRGAVQPLPWASRIAGMPYLPGGGSQQLEALRETVACIADADGLLTATVTIGGATKTLRAATQQIAPSGLLDRIARDHVAPSASTRRWLESGDVYHLLAALHRHIRFVGELLHELAAKPLATSELGRIANDRFSLEWSTLDQIRRRCSWLTSMGLVEYKTSKALGLTELGRELLPLLEQGGPEPQSARSHPAEPVNIPPAPPRIAALLDAATQETLAGRDPVLGYIPRGNATLDAVSSLEILVNACVPSIPRAGLSELCSRTFGTGEGSFGAILTTLTKFGLIEQSGMNIYSATPEAKEWLETQSALDLVRILHTRMQFCLEIVPALSEVDRAPGLADAGMKKFGLPRADVGGIRTRLQLLKSAGLIEERTNWHYQATPLGEEVAARAPLLSSTDSQAVVASERLMEGTVEENASAAEMVARELVESGTASESPIRLEKAVLNAFTFLGMDARHIGGSGQTDVLLTIRSAPGGPTLTAIVDAKSARSGHVGEGSIQFDTLAEHKTAHGADFVCIVGPNFDSGRVRPRAAQNNVGLITTEELAATIRRHARTPRSAADFVDVLSPDESAREALQTTWTVDERRNALLGHVAGVLAAESRDEDEVTGGALGLDQIYLIVRGEVDPRPAPHDIEDALSLLRHPLIGAVTTVINPQTKVATYALMDSPMLIASKLRSLARIMDRMDDSLPD